MHLRGKSFRYEANYPDGTKEILLDVPHYDFAWQNTYELAEPKLMPKGTSCTASPITTTRPTTSPIPIPSALVHWGDQTWDEMMIGYVDVTLPEGSEGKQPPKPRRGEVSAKDQPTR